MTTTINLSSNDPERLEYIAYRNRLKSLQRRSRELYLRIKLHECGNDPKKSFKVLYEEIRGENDRFCISELQDIPTRIPETSRLNKITEHFAVAAFNVARSSGFINNEFLTDCSGINDLLHFSAPMTDTIEKIVRHLSS